MIYTSKRVFNRIIFDRIHDFESLNEKIDFLKTELINVLEW